MWSARTFVESWLRWAVRIVCEEWDNLAVIPQSPKAVLGSPVICYRVLRVDSLAWDKQPCFCGYPDCLGHERSADGKVAFPGFTSFEAMAKSQQSHEIVRLLDSVIDTPEPHLPMKHHSTLTP
jgi:hypothetical protein